MADDQVEDCTGIEEVDFIENLFTSCCVEVFGQSREILNSWAGTVDGNTDEVEYGVCISAGGLVEALTARGINCTNTDISIGDITVEPKIFLDVVTFSEQYFKQIVFNRRGLEVSCWVSTSGQAVFEISGNRGDDEYFGSHLVNMVKDFAAYEWDYKSAMHPASYKPVVETDATILALSAKLNTPVRYSGDADETVSFVDIIKPICAKDYVNRTMSLVPKDDIQAWKKLRGELAGNIKQFHATTLESDEVSSPFADCECRFTLSLEAAMTLSKLNLGKNKSLGWQQKVTGVEFEENQTSRG